MSATQPIMHAVLSTGNADAPVVVSQTPLPVPRPSEALVRVHAVSLNPGELRRARARAAHEPIGWDFAGVVERAARRERSRGTADFAPRRTCVENPYSAFRARVGSGSSRCSLRSARVRALTAVIRSESNAALVRKHGADKVAVGPTADASKHGPFDLIVESLGGESLGAALAMIARRRHGREFRSNRRGTTTFSAAAFYATGGATLYGFIIFHTAVSARNDRQLSGKVVVTIA
jgi:NADPH2:quinone reductase